MAETEEIKALHLMLAKRLVDRVDDFRFKHRFETRKEAIEWLLEAALNAKLAPAKE